MARFGLDAAPGEPESVKLLRPSLMRHMAQLGHDPVSISHGESLVDVYFEHPDLVDSSLLPDALIVSAIRGDRALFDRYRERIETTKLPTERSAFLTALASFGNDALADSALAYALAGPLRGFEVAGIPRAMLEVPGRDQKVFDWVRANYGAISARMPDIHRQRLATYSAGCTKERVAALKAFFSEPAHRPIGIQRSLDKAVAQTEECATLREKEGPAVAAWLEGMIGAK